MKNRSDSRQTLWAVLVIFVLLAGGCAESQNRHVVNISSSREMPEDVDQLPQNLYRYTHSTAIRLLSPEQQAQMNAKFDALYFSPWHAAHASMKASEAFAIFGGTKKSSKPRGWAENLLPWTQQNWAKLVANAARESFPSRLDTGITVHTTVLREAPTLKPRFGDPAKAGRGFPFDMFMYSTLPAGMPVLIVHTSADGAWVYVETALATGWVPAVDVAVVNATFRNRFECGAYAVFLEDEVPLRDSEGRFVCMGTLGTVLPIVSLDKDSATLWAPVRTVQGEATLLKVTAPATAVALKPIPLTEDALARIGNNMMGQAYGWGGMFGDRDCSLMLRDMFVPFGIWLPRNSAAQAKSWDFRDFSHLSPADKERMILRQGKPFATLLWLPGHIALYVGEYEGRAVMFHSLWGIRTQQRGREGRYIIGRAVVTSLRPGRELPDIQNREGLVARMRGMSILH